MLARPQLGWNPASKFLDMSLHYQTAEGARVAGRTSTLRRRAASLQVLVETLGTPSPAPPSPFRWDASQYDSRKSPDDA